MTKTTPELESTLRHLGIVADDAAVDHWTEGDTDPLEAISITPAMALDKEARLQEAFGFSLKDLDCNRQQRISQDQRKKVRGYIISLVEWGCVAVAFLFWLFATDPSEEDLFANLSATLPILVMVFVIYSAYAGTAIISFFQAPFHDLSEGRAAYIDGEIQMQRILFTTWITIGIVKMRAPRAAYDYLQEGERLRIYYTPGTKLTLAAEPLIGKREDE